MSRDSWASCPVLPWDCRNAKWSSLRISFPSSSFLLPLFLLLPGGWREDEDEGRGVWVWMCVNVCLGAVWVGGWVQIATELYKFPTSQQYRSSDYSSIIILAARRTKSKLISVRLCACAHLCGVCKMERDLEVDKVRKDELYQATGSSSFPPHAAMSPEALHWLSSSPSVFHGLCLR